eukprot:5631311-Alexandrium_andersonii.AAC.1
MAEATKARVARTAPKMAHAERCGAGSIDWRPRWPRAQARWTSRWRPPPPGVMVSSTALAMANSRWRMREASGTPRSRMPSNNSWSPTWALVHLVILSHPL